ANIEMPEYKAFLVNIEPIAGPNVVASGRVSMPIRATSPPCSPTPSATIREPTSERRGGNDGVRIRSTARTDPERESRSGRGRPRSPFGLVRAAACKAADAGREADRCVEMHRLQGLSSRLHGVER